jgi:hypothetical protein
MKIEKNAGSYEQLYHNLINRTLKGKGESSREQREAAFNNSGLLKPVSALINKVAHHAYRVTDDDISEVKNAGLSEDQLFELIVCAATGEASRQYESGLAALAEVTGKGGLHAS